MFAVTLPRRCGVYNRAFLISLLVALFNGVRHTCAAESAVAEEEPEAQLTALQWALEQQRRAAAEAAQANASAHTELSRAAAKLSAMQAGAEAAIEGARKAEEERSALKLRLEQAEANITARIAKAAEVARVHAVAEASAALQAKELELQRSQQLLKELRAAAAGSPLGVVSTHLEQQQRLEEAQSRALGTLHIELQQKLQELDACEKAMASRVPLEASASRLATRLEEMVQLLRPERHKDSRQEMSLLLARARAEVSDIQMVMQAFRDHTTASSMAKASSWTLQLNEVRRLAWTTAKFWGFFIEGSLQPLAGQYARPLSFGVLVFVVTAVSVSLWQILSRPCSLLAEALSKRLWKGADATGTNGNAKMTTAPAPVLEPKQHSTKPLRKSDETKARPPALQRLDSPLSREVARSLSPAKPKSALLQSPKPSLGPSPKTASSARASSLGVEATTPATDLDTSPAQHFFIGDEDSQGQRPSRRPMPASPQRAAEHSVQHLGRHISAPDTLEGNSRSRPKSVTILDTPDAMKASLSTPISRRGGHGAPHRASSSGRVEAMVAELEATQRQKAAVKSPSRHREGKPRSSALDEKVAHMEIHGILRKLERLEGTMEEFRRPLEAVADLAKVLPRAVPELRNAAASRSRSK
mmetsp:Transcript_44493/g.105437  ORF Transcript_44493/g.105437 Transcript_44493/m.105437 type:complete len:645 (-) Transcript_44493:71-2005(-)